MFVLLVCSLVRAMLRLPTPGFLSSVLSDCSVPGAREPESQRDTDTKSQGFTERRCMESECKGGQPNQRVRSTFA